MKLTRSLLGVVLLVAATGGAWYFFKGSRQPDEIPDNDPPHPWKVTCVNPNLNEPALLWNGEFGLRISRRGFGYDEAGKPLEAFNMANYEASGEEKILVQENPLDSHILMNGKDISTARLSGYKQVLDFKTGILRTSYRAEAGGANVFFEQELQLDDSSGDLIEKWNCTAISAVKLEFKTGEKGTNPWTTETEKNLVVRGTFLAQRRHLLNSANVKSDTPLSACDIEIDGADVTEDQQAIRSMLFYLRTGISSQTTHVSPFMLSNSSYFGHVFWDSDIWVFPALALLDPNRARVIPQYRLGHVTGAQLNAKSTLKKWPEQFSHPELIEHAAQFPWESSVSGNETVRSSSEKEIHISASVLFGLQMAADLGLADQKAVSNLGKLVANFYLARSIPGRDGKLELKDVMSPDENFTGDNDLYTNMLAQWVVDQYAPEVRARFYMPRDEKTFLTYDGDRLKKYKQAAALLTVYPLGNPLAVADASKMFDRFAGKTISSGPAMTDSIDAIVATKIGRTSTAYDTWRKGWFDFTRHPLLLFSEKRKMAKTYFLTGAAGSIQTVLYGFVGLHLSEKKDEKSIWSKQLKSGKWIGITPSIPKQWKSIFLHGLTLDGVRYDLQVTRSGVAASKL